MRTAVPSSMRELLRYLVKEGYTVERRRRHWAVRLPDGRLKTLSSTPDPRTIRNILADLHRERARAARATRTEDVR